MRASEEASRKAYNEEQKQLEEEGYAAHREISSDPSDERIAERNRQIQNDIRYSADKKALAADNAGRLINMPYEQRKIEMAQSGATVAERKPSIIQQNTGSDANIVSIPAFGGAPTTISSTPMGATPREKFDFGPKYVAEVAARDKTADDIKKTTALYDSSGSTPMREVYSSQLKDYYTRLSQQDKRLADMAALKQPVDAKEKLIKDYYAGITAGRSPKEPEMMDMMAQIQYNRSFAPPTRINVNSFDTASNAAQKDFILESAKQRTTLRNSKGAIDNINKAITLIPSSAQFMGPGGEPLLNAASFLNNRLGLTIDTKGITNATELRSRMFSNVIDTLKKLDSQPSERQQATLEKALGTIGEDPNALVNVLRAFQDVIRGKVEDYNADVTEAEKRGVKFPYKPQIDIGEYGGRTPPTSAAIAGLKANPRMRADFEDKFGPGSADKVLGKGK
jgi:hypothetical protein